MRRPRGHGSPVEPTDPASLPVPPTGSAPGALVHRWTVVHTTPWSVIGPAMTRDGQVVHSIWTRTQVDRKCPCGETSSEVIDGRWTKEDL